MVIQSLTWLLYMNNTCQRLIYQNNTKKTSQFQTFQTVLNTYVGTIHFYLCTTDICLWWKKVQFYIYHFIGIDTDDVVIVYYLFCLFIILYYYFIELEVWGMRYEVWDRFKLFLYKSFNLVILGIVPKEHVLKTRKAVYI
jgi:hypothetical protein